jgi:hypothetical protein
VLRENIHYVKNRIILIFKVNHKDIYIKYETTEIRSWKERRAEETANNNIKATG